MRILNKLQAEASALVITMIVIFIAVACIGTAVHVTTTTARQTDSSRDFSTLRSAAEGALDFAYGIWVEKVNTTFGPVSNKTLNDALVTVPSFAATNGVSVSYDASAGYSGPQITGIDLAQYGQAYGPLTANSNPPSTKVPLIDNTGRNKFPGWLGMNTSYLASVKMSATFLGNRTVKYGVKRAINYTTVPLFQATAFFEDDMELYRPAPMTIDGLVHTNGKASVSQGSAGGGSGGGLTFTGNLSYVTGYLDSTAPYPADDPVWRQTHSPTTDWWSGYVANAAFPPNYPAGFDQQVTEVTRMEPLGVDAATILSATPPPYNITTNHNSDSARELIEPPNTYVDPITHVITSTNSFPDTQAIADRRVYNKAGIRIRISKTGTTTTYTVTTANGATLTAAQKTALTNALSQTSMYDRREATNVDVTSFDLSAALSTLNASTAKFNGILYIDDISSTGYADPKAIRLVNGSTLPSNGFTVGSENPIYIQGDYNTSGARVPSAVFADAVTILSNAWKDSNSSGALSARNANDTTVNTAIVCGFVPSEWVNPVTHETYGYSGGLNNFPRFLEDWSSNTFTYKGSMIELFASGIATGQWDTGSVYHPPNRAWSFDSNFIDNPPPGSLTAVTVSRGAFVRF